jgi:hypothetical protein
MLEADMLLAGLAGRPPTGPENDVEGAGDAPAATGFEVAETLVTLECRGKVAELGTDGGAAEPVGVGCGVDAAELAFVMEIGAGVFLALEGGAW